MGIIKKIKDSLFNRKPKKDWSRISLVSGSLTNLHSHNLFKLDSEKNELQFKYKIGEIDEQTYNIELSRIQSRIERANKTYQMMKQTVIN